MELQTKRLQLTELTSADLDNIHNLHSSPQVDAYNTLGIPVTIYTTKNLLQEWIIQQRQTPRPSYIFCIKQSGNNHFVGLIALVLGKPNFKIAEVWYKLMPQCWQQGFATEALKQVLHFGFTHLGLHRIEAGCAVENTASVKVLQKVGMMQEGRKSKVLPVRGEWLDNYFFAILDTDFYYND